MARVSNPDAPSVHLLKKPPTKFAVELHQFIEAQTGAKISLQAVSLACQLRKSFTELPHRKREAAKRKAILAAAKEAALREEAKWARSEAKAQAAGTAEPDGEEEAPETELPLKPRRGRPPGSGKKPQAEAAEPDEPDDNDDDEPDEEEQPAKSGKAAAVLDEEPDTEEPDDDDEDSGSEEDEEEEEEDEPDPPLKASVGRSKPAAVAAKAAGTRAKNSSRKPAPF